MLGFTLTSLLLILTGLKKFSFLIVKHFKCLNYTPKSILGFQLDKLFSFFMI